MQQIIHLFCWRYKSNSRYKSIEICLDSIHFYCDLFIQLQFDWMKKIFSFAVCSLHIAYLTIERYNWTQIDKPSEWSWINQRKEKFVLIFCLVGLWFVCFGSYSLICFSSDLRAQWTVHRCKCYAEKRWMHWMNLIVFVYRIFG